ncbi:MAG: DUF3320 domain-containing protein, partial [Flavobacterium sp.]
LKSEQIDLNRTNSEGVMGLKAFLAYAEKGKVALPIRSKTGNSEGMGYEHLIAKELIKHGYEVHSQIGCSAYKIDLAIVDKKNSSSYILGILTDGKNYQRAHTSKDREVTQLNVLHQLGWNIHKVWSTEWWEKPDRVTNDILEAIRLAENDELRAAIIPQPSPNPEKEIFINALTKNELIKNDEVFQTSIINKVEANQEIPNFYTLTNLAAINAYSSDEFFWGQNREKIKKQISDVLETEWPISKNLLCKRVLNAWNISRMGTRISYHFQTLLDEMHLSAINDAHREFFWPNESKPEDYKRYRIPKNDFEKRDADDLPAEEVANAISEILGHQISLTKADLIRETGKLFGYARVGTNVEYAMAQGINKAIDLGIAKENNGRIVFNA